MPDIIDDIEEQRRQQIKEIKDLVKKAHLSQGGLSIPEILMLYYARSYNTEYKSFQLFWYYKYGVDNPRALLNSLCDRGFIKEVSTEDSLKNYKIPELKELLKLLGLKQSGKKSELIERLIQNADSTFFEENVKKRGYELTDIGKAELEKNLYVPYFHKSGYTYGVSIWETNEYLHEHPKANFRDYIWGRLNEYTLKATNSIERGDYSYYIQNRFLMAEFLLEENKNYNQALFLIAEGIFLRVNCELRKRYKICIDVYNNSYAEIFSDEYTSQKFTVKDWLYFPIKALKVIKREEKYSDDDLFKSLISHFNKCLESNQLISDLLIPNEDLAGLVLSMMNDDKDLVEIICSQIQSKISKEYIQQTTVAKSQLTEPPMIKETQNVNPSQTSGGQRKSKWLIIIVIIIFILLLRSCFGN